MSNGYSKRLLQEIWPTLLEIRLDLNQLELDEDLEFALHRVLVDLDHTVEDAKRLILDLKEKEG